ncbi:phage integrase SAM-like domain-containing protein [Bacteroides stercoris]|nr:phage integrase SAM-like domain-containing protein [Bacteroides stercoris]
MFKICIVFKISIRRDGGSPCRKRKKEESPAALGSFSGFVREEIARTRLMHRHSTAGNYATALRSLLAFHGKKDISFAEVDSRLIDAYGEWLPGEGGYARTPCLATCAPCVLSTTRRWSRGLRSRKNLSAMCLRAFPAPGNVR